MYRTHKQPVGHATRGKTAAVRLRRLDRFLLRTEEPLFRRHTGLWRDAAYIDLGYGARPTTTLEAAADLRRVNPGLLVIGVEIDPERVAAAAPFADERTRFRRGGFEVPLQSDESVRCIRAMNVLRQYPEDAVDDAYRTMLALLVPGGLLAEGTSNPSGSRMVVNLVHRAEPGSPSRRRVLFSANLRHALESPRELQPVLPKDLIHRVVPGEPIHDFMEAWERAWLQTHPAATFGSRVHFAAAGHALMAARGDVEHRPSLLRQGYLVWRPPQQ
ncbi:MAG: class I SAM-dependent methyltransferase [Myxococcota bacterium]